MFRQVEFAEVDELMDNPPGEKCSCTGNKYVTLSIQDVGFTDSFYRTRRCLECKKAYVEYIEG